MKKLLPLSCAVLLITGCSSEDLFRGAPDDQNISVFEGQKKSINVIGGETGSTYSWSMANVDYLKISESANGEGLVSFDSATGNAYIQASLVESNKTITVSAKETTSKGDSRTHKFNITVVDVPIENVGISGNEGETVELTAVVDPNNTLQWTQVSGPDVTINSNAGSATIVLPTVSESETIEIKLLESNDDGYQKTTMFTVTVDDVPIQEIASSSFSSSSITLNFPNAIEGSTYSWSNSSPYNLSINGTGSEVHVLLPDVNDVASVVLLAEQTAPNGTNTAVRFNIEVTPKLASEVLFEVESGNESAIAVIDGNVESTYSWTQLEGPTVAVTVEGSPRAILNIPTVDTDAIATFIVKETTPVGEINRYNVTLVIKTELENRIDTVSSREYVSQKANPYNTNVLPRISLSDSGQGLVGYSVKYSDSFGIAAAMKNINIDESWETNSTDLAIASELESLDAATSEDYAVIAFIDNAANDRLKYVLRSEGQWGQPVTVASESSLALSDVKVSVNDLGHIAISYIKTNAETQTSELWLSSIHQSYGVKNVKLGSASSVIRTNVAAIVSDINTRNIDSSINFVLDEEEVFNNLAFKKGEAQVFVNNGGKIFVASIEGTNNITVDIDDPTLLQKAGEPNAFPTLTEVNLGYTRTVENTHRFTVYEYSNNGGLTTKFVTQSDTIDLNSVGLLSGQYGIAYQTQNEFGLTDVYAITHNVLKNNSWNDPILMESFDDKSFTEPSIAVSALGRVSVMTSYNAVNGDSGVYVSTIEKDETSPRFLFEDSIASNDGHKLVTIDKYGNTMFGYADNNTLSLFSLAGEESIKIKDVQLINFDHADWATNSNGELVIAVFSDVDSEIVNSKSQ